MPAGQLWSLFYMNVVGWTLHPGYQKPGSERLSLEDCARLADLMLAEYQARFPTTEVH